MTSPPHTLTKQVAMSPPHRVCRIITVRWRGLSSRHNIATLVLKTNCLAAWCNEKSKKWQQHMYEQERERTEKRKRRREARGGEIGRAVGMEEGPAGTHTPVHVAAWLVWSSPRQVRYTTIHPSHHGDHTPAVPSSHIAAVSIRRVNKTGVASSNNQKTLPAVRQRNTWSG